MPNPLLTCPVFPLAMPIRKNVLAVKRKATSMMARENPRFLLTGLKLAVLTHGGCSYSYRLYSALMQAHTGAIAHVHRVFQLAVLALGFSVGCASKVVGYA
jgi:hypothetical protein